jgi:hypothetical protein
MKLIDADWRAANDLSVGHIRRYDNPLLEKPSGIRSGEFDEKRNCLREIKSNLSCRELA